MRLLIVEDDNASRLFMEKYLSRYGDCETARDGLEAIYLVDKSLDEKRYYDLICIDIIIPKINGIKLFKSIKELEKKYKIEKDMKTEIIFISSLCDKETFKEINKYDYHAYLWKPLDVNILKEELKKINIYEKYFFDSE